MDLMIQQKMVLRKKNNNRNREKGRENFKANWQNTGTDRQNKGTTRGAVKWSRIINRDDELVEREIDPEFYDDLFEEDDYFDRAKQFKVKDLKANSNYENEQSLKQKLQEIELKMLKYEKEKDEIEQKLKQI